MCADRTPPVLRPSLPPLLWVSAAMWAGIAVAERISWAYYIGAPGSERWLLAAVVIASAGLLVTRRRVCLMVALGLVCGVAAGALFWSDYRSDVSRALARGEARWCVDLPEDPGVGRFGAKSEAVAVTPSRGARVTCLWPEGAQVPELGTRVFVGGSLRPPTADERGRRAHRSGVVGTLSPKVIAEQRWSPTLSGLVGPVRLAAVRFLDTVPGPGGALLNGVVAGDRRRLEGSSAEEDFRVTGLTHLVAISGGHLVVVAGLVAWAMSRAGIGRSAVAVTVLAVLAAYVAATGMQSSAIRAWLMTAVVALALASGRRADPLSGLGLALVVSFAVDPTSAFDVGLQLSAAAVAGLLVFARLAEAWMRQGVPAVLGWMAAPLALTLTAQVATTPVSAGTFGVVSLVAPVANLLVGPIVTFVLFAGLASVALRPVCAPVARTIALTAGAAGALAADIAARLAAVPGAAAAFDDATAVSACCLLCGALVWVCWPQPSRRIARWIVPTALAMWSVFAVGIPVRGADGLVMCDVGQGDMLVIQDGRDAAMVDTGPSANAAIAAISRSGIRRVDPLVLTHMHSDHIGGLDGFGGIISAAGVVVPASDEVGELKVPRGCGEPYGVVAGHTMAVGEYELRVLWPPSKVDDPAENAASVVLLLTTDRFTALLTGDAEDDVLTHLIADGAVGDVDVLKLGHHGSNGAVSSATLSVLRPEVVLVSVGAGNRYGHPTAPTLDVLQRSGARILRTDQSGDVRIVVDRAGYRIETQKDGTAAMACGTLFAAVYRTIHSDKDEGINGQQDHKPQVRLSHLRDRGASSGAGAPAPEGVRWRGG